MKWDKDFPAIEGWYFWRRNSKGSDPLHWESYFYEEEADIFWKSKSIEFMPRSGEWAGPIPEPE